MTAPTVDPDEQLAFLLGHIEHLRAQTDDPMNRTQIGVTEHRYGQALDAFAAIVTRYKGRLTEDDTIRDVMHALGFEVGAEDDED